MGRKQTFLFPLLILVLALCGYGLALRWQPRAVITTSSDTSDGISISGAVVPHHDLVEDKREAFLTALARETNPETVVLVSPNHYESGHGAIQITDEPWELSTGTLQPNRAVIASLTSIGIASQEPQSFSNEHGIRNVLPDIRQSFPEATIVPIILKSSIPSENLDLLHDRLLSDCASCLLIASVDFSHYQPAVLADIHDSLAVRALQSRDRKALRERAEVDSGATLELLARWADAHSTPRFALEGRSNSGDISGKPDEPTTTHVFGWYETGEPSTPAPSVSFVLAGDMMFDRSVAHETVFAGKSYESILEEFGDRTFWGVDLGMANLEGPISDIPVEDDIRPNNLIFNFPPQTVDALRYLRLNGVSLGNNHSDNAGSKGLATTRRLLDEAGIAWASGPGQDDVEHTVQVIGQDLTLHVIAPHVLAGVTDLDDQIRALDADPKNRIIVFPHWGAEYKPIHGQSQETLAHAWIDAGADAVIGAHPHVVQDTELYRGKPIIYSLGNFIFDQFFSAETMQGLVVAGEFTEDSLRLVILPTINKHLDPQFDRGASKERRLDALLAPFGVHVQTTRAGRFIELPFSEAVE